MENNSIKNFPDKKGVNKIISIKKDFDKFMELSKINQGIYCYFVVLVKNNKVRGDLKILLSKIGENFKFITNYSAI
jgi:hypothetical protein|nr:hypothetical protein [uncultured Campylobacter sp.]